MKKVCSPASLQPACIIFNVMESYIIASIALLCIDSYSTYISGNDTPL